MDLSVAALAVVERHRYLCVWPISFFVEENALARWAVDQVALHLNLQVDWLQIKLLLIPSLKLIYFFRQLSLASNLERLIYH